VIALLAGLRRACIAWAPRVFARICRPSDDELGRLGEEVAARWLRSHGARLLARRLRLAEGEIDILACDARGLVCVEVKSGRQSPPPLPRDAGLAAAPMRWRPAGRVDWKRRRRLLAGARRIARTHGLPARVEVLEVVLDERTRALCIERTGVLQNAQACDT
jgi:Holliday junction resolvase-like predicted endonuclease